MNNRGGIAVMAAILAMPILLGFGLALDASMLWLLRQRLQWAVDTAALLGASQTNIVKTADLVTPDVQALFWASYGAPSTNPISPPNGVPIAQVGYLGSSSGGATVTPATTAVPQVTVTASATLPTTVMRIMGQNMSTVMVTGQAAVPHKVEMTLVLDNSLSMGAQLSDGTVKLDALKAAAQNMLTTILGSGSSQSPNVSMGIVPFAGAVNVGTDAVAQSFLRGGAPGSNFPGSVGSNTGWRGCVQARANAAPAASYDTTEEPPSVQAFDPYFYPSTYTAAHKLGYIGDNDWTSNNVNDTSTASQSTNTNYIPNLSTSNPLYYGPNLFCPHLPLVKLTSSKTALSTAITSMALVNGGGTIVNQGLQWGWFTLSPLWTAWGLPNSATNATRPAAYTDTGTTKIIVLMTDGMNEVDGANTFYGSAATPNWYYTGQYATNCNGRMIYPECYPTDLTNPWYESWYTSYGRVSSGVLTPMPPALNMAGDKVKQAAAATLRTRLQTLCSNIKNHVIIYTIFFHGTFDDTISQSTTGLAVNPAGTDLQKCATDSSHYFDSQSASSINAGFQTIAQNINDLRVTQ